ncbi:Transglutaminase-like superfamily protein [Pseudobutyrivibrio sp. UC1225]|nr:Transglutaminase-like superfamily protein [Pseudobutyrivibrio sp. UC1225]
MKERVAALFAVEKKLHLFVFALITICLEIFLLVKGDSYDLNRGSFVLTFILFFFLYAVLEFILHGIVENKAIPLFSLIPAVLMFFLLKVNEKWSDIAIAVLLAVVVRIIFDYLPFRDKVILFGTFVLDGSALYLRMYWTAFWGDKLLDKLLFVALVVLTLSSIQHIIWGRKEGGFPFNFFLLLGCFLIFIPMNRDPIDWSRLEGVFGNAADATAYYLCSVIGDSEYTVGYGSFNATGSRISNSDKLQLVLESVERPYFVYTDAETGKKMKMRRVLYLAGGKGVDGKALVEWLQFLKDNDIDKEEAEMFSQISKLDVEYVYLDTADEIAPAGALVLTNQDGFIEKGRSDDRHRKGYKIKAKYLDIDYGSPLLVELFQNPKGSLIDREPMTYQEASEYYLSLYNQDLKDVMNASEYEEYLKQTDMYQIYGDTEGVSDRMEKLASDITAKADNDYLRAKLIEIYLRQYTYNTKAVGGHNPDSDMSTSKGMADIADRFLFETESGYCVHYTSSMVMMLRSIGIPARAVIGYRYSFPFEIQENYVVEANCAHVWPEAYIENVGWIPFEPTSAYSTAGMYSWHRNETIDPETENEIQLEVQDLPDIPEGAEQQETYKNEGLQLIKIIGIVILSIVLLILVIWAGAILARRIIYKLASPEKKIRIDVEMTKARLIKESDKEFKDRGLLSDYLKLAPEEEQEEIKQLFDSYYKVVYGND